MVRFSSSPFLIKDVVCEAHILASRVRSFYTTLAGWLLGLDICGTEVAAAAIADFLALWTRPSPNVAQDVAGIHVEVAEETSIAEEGSTFIAASSFPLGMIDAAEMAEAGDLGGFGSHEVVDSRSERFECIHLRRRLGLKTHDLTGAVQDASALFRGDDLGPNIRMNVLTGAPVEIAKQTKVEVGTLRTADVAIPDGCAAKVACCDNILG